jgi:CheY-like chemotaxis protein
VLDTVRDGLIGHGYQVLSATGGDEALQVAQAHQGPIALLGRKVHDILVYRSPFSRPLQPPR